MGSVWRVGWASVATALPMGQQRYEVEIQRALRLLAQDSWTFRSLAVTSLRSKLPADRRVPRALAERAPRPVAEAIAAWTYRGVDLVHRFDLRLPPARREVLTVHDVAPWRFPDEGEVPTSAVRSLHAAAAVIAPSEFAAGEIRTVLGVTDVRVVPHGLGELFGGPIPATAEALHELGIPGPYVLHTGGATQRKNLAGLAGAWLLLCAEFPEVSLVLTGPPDDRRDAAFAGLPRIVMVGMLPDARIPALMAGAQAVVVPSMYEGFGLPALEAMACGAPVVAAAAGSLPEVCGDAAMLVEPSAEGIARGLAQLLRDEQVRRNLAALGPERAALFSWERAAQEHLAIYTEAMG